MAELEFEPIVWKEHTFLARPNQYIAKLDDSLEDAEFEDTLNILAATSPGGVVIQRAGPWGVIRVDSSVDLLDAISRAETLAAESDLLDFVEPDFQVKGLTDYTVPSSDRDVWQWSLQAMNMEEAWEIEMGNDKVFVVIVDTGLARHRELIPGQFLSGGNFYHDSSSPPSRVDGVFIKGSLAGIVAESNHGVYLAGIIAAKADGVGVTGINRRTPIGICRALADQTRGSASGVTAGVLQAIEGAKKIGKNLIVNLSLELADPIKAPQITGLLSHADSGTILDPANSQQFRFSSSFLFMCREAQKAGALLVCGAGNSSEQKPRLPAGYASIFSNNMLSVGYTQNSPAPGLSIRGEYLHPSTHGGVDLVAPGTNIPVITYRDGEFSLDGIKAYQNKALGEEGSSVATAHVTGVASLVWSKFSGLSAKGVIERLKDTADLPKNYNGDTRWGAGRVNAHKALLSRRNDFPQSPHI